MNDLLLNTIIPKTALNRYFKMREVSLINEFFIPSEITKDLSTVGFVCKFKSIFRNRI